MLLRGVENVSDPELVDATLIAQRLNSRNIKLVRNSVDWINGHGAQCLLITQSYPRARKTNNPFNITWRRGGGQGRVAGAGASRCVCGALRQRPSPPPASRTPAATGAVEGILITRGNRQTAKRFCIRIVWEIKPKKLLIQNHYP